MKTWIPTLVASAGTREARVCGLPFGFPATRWPRCARCHAPLALLVQIPHDDLRADLGARDRMLYVFQCADLDRQGCCELEVGGPGTACFILDGAEQTAGVTAAPPCEAEIDRGWTFAAWEHTDDVNAEDVALGEEPAPLTGTRLGGAPGWIQGGCEMGPTWRFLLQVDTTRLPEDQETQLRGLGIAYVFVSSDRAREVCLIWEC